MCIKSLRISAYFLCIFIITSCTYSPSDNNAGEDTYKNEIKLEKNEDTNIDLGNTPIYDTTLEDNSINDSIDMDSDSSNDEFIELGYYVDMVGFTMNIQENNLSTEEILYKIIEQVFMLYMDKGVSDYQRITEYKVEDIYIEEENDKFYRFRITYSTKGATDKIAVIGSGQGEEDNWIVDICKFITVEKNQNEVTIVYVGTSPEPLK